MAYYAHSLPGSSSQQPIFVSNTGPSSSPSSASAVPSSSSTKALHPATQWNAPMHPLTTLESFAWPSMWFQLPSPTTGVAQSSNASSSTNMFPYVTDLECPELDRTCLLPLHFTPPRLTFAYLVPHTPCSSHLDQHEHIISSNGME